MSKVLAGQYISDEIYCDGHFNDILLEVLLNCCFGLYDALSPELSFYSLHAIIYSALQDTCYNNTSQGI